MDNSKKYQLGWKVFFSDTDNLTLSYKRLTNLFQLCNTDSSPFMYIFILGEQSQETSPVSSQSSLLSITKFQALLSTYHYFFPLSHKSSSFYVLGTFLFSLLQQHSFISCFSKCNYHLTKPHEHLHLCTHIHSNQQYYSFSLPTVLTTLNCTRSKQF